MPISPASASTRWVARNSAWWVAGSTGSPAPTCSNSPACCSSRLRTCARYSASSGLSSKSTQRVLSSGVRVAAAWHLFPVTVNDDCSGTPSRPYARAMTATAAAGRTRSKRSADSRLLILDAAVACLVEDGYAGASTLAVQARAGVSRGRLLHHFPSRAELLVAAAQYLATSSLTELQQRATGLMAGRPPGPARVDQAIDLMWVTFHEPPFWAALELWAAARTDPALRRALQVEEPRLRAAIQAVADGIWGPEVTGAPLYGELCQLLFTSMRGVALVYAFEERSPVTDPHVTLWKRLARRLLYGAPDE